MTARLRFLGAAQNITGSRHLLDTDNVRLLVDCGLHQERQFKGRDWDTFPAPPSSIDAVLLTHAHLDHCGFVPRLASQGFQGPVYCTPATADIARIMLLDAAHIQEEDAAYKAKRHRKENRRGPYPEVPLYTVEEAEASLALFHSVPYGEEVELADGVTASFHDAGHVLGSAMIRVTMRENSDRRTVLFSGDVGRWNKPMLKDPTLFEQADYVVVEATYGDRLHEDQDTIASTLAQAIRETLDAGGNILVPSFALERAQEVLYYLNVLMSEGRIPPLLVFLDSPMAVSITEVFKHHPELFDSEMNELMAQGHSPFDFPGLHMVRTVEQSKTINNVTGTAMIIAGSGMCTGGRIKHHLVRNISRAESTVLFVGYQADGTLGRHIVDGADEVRVLGTMRPSRARVVQVQGFSAHADRDELLRWLSGLHSAPRRLFVVHTEPEAGSHFARLAGEKAGCEAHMPAYLDEVVLT
ncbi:MAG: MBL fold metallo-hydrolase RNA specificity domain-containing protein [Chloroflexota bacterium]